MSKKIKVYNICWHFSIEGEEKGFDFDSLPDEVVVDGFSKEEIEDFNSDDDERIEKVAVKLENWLYDNYGYSTECFNMKYVDDKN